MIRVTVDRVVVEGVALSEKEIRRRLEEAFQNGLVAAGWLVPARNLPPDASPSSSIATPRAGTSHPAATEDHIARIVREAFGG